MQASLHGLGEDVVVQEKMSRCKWQGQRCLFEPLPIVLGLRILDKPSQVPMLHFGPSLRVYTFLQFHWFEFNDPSGVRRFWKKFLRWPRLKWGKPNTTPQDTMHACFECGWHAPSIRCFRCFTIAATICHKRDESACHCSCQNQDQPDGCKQMQPSFATDALSPFPIPRIFGSILKLPAIMEIDWGATFTYANVYEFSKNEKELFCNLSNTPGTNGSCCN